MNQALSEAQQLAEITDAIIGLAQLDFRTFPPIRGKGPLDAVAAGLKALGEELQASVVARHEAEKANEAKAEFLANMSHDFRTPLTIIMGNIDLLSNTSLSESQLRMIKQVKEAGDLLLRLITDVLDFSKIEAGTLKIEAHPFNLGASIASIIEQHRLLAEQKGLQLFMRRPLADDTAVLGDRHRIEQVVSNLLSNAIKFTNQGQIEVLMSTSLESLEEDRLLFSLTVRDTGIGIAPDSLERIFERFSTEDASIRRQQHGTGLGLSIARSLATSMGGSLSVESTLGRGSSFHLRLPMPITQAVQNNGGGFPSEYAAIKVLVVDDTAPVRDVTAEMLEALGCTASSAASGQEALNKVDQQDFDLILMDCQMPLMDGLETTRRMLALHPERDLQIVAITAHTTSHDEQKSKNAGMKAHLNKPYGIEQLRELLVCLKDGW